MGQFEKEKIEHDDEIKNRNKHPLDKEKEDEGKEGDKGS